MDKMLQRVSNSQIASTADIDESALVLNSKIGKECWLAHGSMICYSELGDMSYLSTRSKAFSCCIGKYSSISWNVSIGPANHDYHRISTHSMLFATRFGMISNQSERYYNQYDKDTIVGSDVWIGCNAIIMRGVHVGDGAVIGANSVITKDVAPYTIMGGANVCLRNRFSEDIVHRLLEIKWWNYPVSIIKKCLDLRAQEPTNSVLDELDNKLRVLSSICDD